MEETKNYENNAESCVTNTVIIKFHFYDNIYTDTFNMYSSIRDVKEKLNEIFHIDDNTVEIHKDGNMIEDDLTLYNIGAFPLGTLELDLKSPSGVDLNKVYQPYHMPNMDVIMVHVVDGKEIKELVVEIERADEEKPWLGGYRNKKTNKTYHDAATQTIQHKRYNITMDSKAVETSEFSQQHISTNTMSNKLIQTLHPIVPEINDKIIEVSDKPYETYDDWLSKNNVIARVIRIQNWYRNVILRRKQKIIVETLTQYKEQQVSTKHEMIKQLDKEIEEPSDLQQKTQDTKLYPSSRHDFDVLYMMIGKWWSSEVQRIRDIKDETVKKAQYMKLLQREIYYLAKLDRYRAEAAEKAKQKLQLNQMIKASKPKKMITSNNKEITIDTLETQRACIIKNMYVEIIRTDVNKTERAEILHKLSQMMESFEELSFTRPLLLLINRELHEMSIGVPKRNLEMTRKRIELLYSKFLNLPEFHTDLSSIRMGKSSSSKRTTPEHKYYTCSRCNRTLPSSEYPSNSQKLAHRICNSCEWVENVGNKRIDLKPYKQMLKNVQKTELEKHSYNSLCFGLQPSGMYYLVNVIWDGHSAINENSDINKLQCVRWNRMVEWSPWNCIVLTNEEAELHKHINDIFEFYSADFVTKVNLRHISARIQFLSLAEAEDKVEFTGAFDKFHDTSVFLDKNYVASFMSVNEKVLVKKPSTSSPVSF